MPRARESGPLVRANSRGHVCILAEAKSQVCPREIEEGGARPGIRAHWLHFLDSCSTPPSSMRAARCAFVRRHARAHFSAISHVPRLGRTSWVGGLRPTRRDKKRIFQEKLELSREGAGMFHHLPTMPFQKAWRDSPSKCGPIRLVSALRHLPSGQGLGQTVVFGRAVGFSESPRKRKSNLLLPSGAGRGKRGSQA